MNVIQEDIMYQRKNYSEKGDVARGKGMDFLGKT